MEWSEFGRFGGHVFRGLFAVFSCLRTQGADGCGGPGRTAVKGVKPLRPQTEKNETSESCFQPIVRHRGLKDFNEQLLARNHTAKALISDWRSEATHMYQLLTIHGFKSKLISWKPLVIFLEDF